MKKKINFDPSDWADRQENPVKTQQFRARSSEYGLCSKCNEFRYYQRKLLDEVVFCHANRTRMIHKIDPIIKCSDFYPAGQMNIFEMANCATLIDVRKDPIGFQQECIKVIITKPEDRCDD